MSVNMATSWVISGTSDKISHTDEQYNEWINRFELNDDSPIEKVADKYCGIGIFNYDANYVYINSSIKTDNDIMCDVKYITSIETLLKEGIFDEICANDKTGCLFGTFMDVSNTIIDYIVVV
jgi:hypothetical protein